MVGGASLLNGCSASQVAMAAAAAAAAASAYNPYNLYTTAHTTSGVNSNNALTNYYDDQNPGLGNASYSHIPNCSITSMHTNSLSSSSMGGNPLNTLSTATVEGTHGGIRYSIFYRRMLSRKDQIFILILNYIIFFTLS